MPIDVVGTLRRAVRQLEAEEARIDRQLAAIRGVFGTLDSAGGRASRRVRAGRTRRRRRMSAAARRAISQQMKAYWMKRQGAGAKEKGKAKAASRRK